MNLKTGVILILFGVSLASIVVGQRLMIRSVSFDSGQMTRELSDIKEQNRVLQAEYAKKRDPLVMLQSARDFGIQILPPTEDLPDIPGKPKEEKGEG
ncbi:MAG: hypothetical protein L3J82_09730 [Planctomycetes bacterium]|nr:hypothetical protein [Planctomycetota bacterium]